MQFKSIYFRVCALFAGVVLLDNDSLFRLIGDLFQTFKRCISLDPSVVSRIAVRRMQQVGQTFAITTPNAWLQIAESSLDLGFGGVRVLAQVKPPVVQVV